MTWPCPTCLTENDLDATDCVACGTGRGDDGPTPGVPVVTLTPGGRPPDAAPIPPAADDPTPPWPTARRAGSGHPDAGPIPAPTPPPAAPVGTPPQGYAPTPPPATWGAPTPPPAAWSTPTPAPVAPIAPTPPPVAAPGPPATGGQGRIVAAVVITFVLVTLIGGAAAVALLGGDDDPTASGSDATIDIGQSDGDDASGSPAPDGGGGAANSGGGEAPAVEVPTTTRPPTTVPSATPPGAPYPLGSWVVVRLSVQDQQAAESWRAENLSSGTVLDTDLYASLTPDYYAVVIGPFASGADAVARCRADGLNDRNSCFGALLSADPADRDQRAYPD